MSLQDKYSKDFESLWSIYPRWPTGRSKKLPSFQAFKRANKALGFTQDDLSDIKADIEERLRICITWQKGDRFGPVMFATYFNQRLWNEPYEKVWRKERKHHVETPAESTEDRDRKYWNTHARRLGIETVPDQFRHLLDH